MRSKRGNYIVEAAIVFPVVIMVMITAVLIIMFFFSQMTEKSRLHIAVRHEAGVLTEQTYCIEPAVVSDAEILPVNELKNKALVGKKNVFINNSGVLSNVEPYKIEGSCYLVDGCKYVRYCNLIKGIKDE